MRPKVVTSLSFSDDTRANAPLKAGRRVDDVMEEEDANDDDEVTTSENIVARLRNTKSSSIFEIIDGLDPTSNCPAEDVKPEELGICNGK